MRIFEATMTWNQIITIVCYTFYIEFGIEVDVRHILCIHFLHGFVCIIIQNYSLLILLNQMSSTRQENPISQIKSCWRFDRDNVDSNPNYINYFIQLTTIKYMYTVFSVDILVKIIVLKLSTSMALNIWHMRN